MIWMAIRRAVEWTTVNASAENQGRNGSIKQQIRLVTGDNDKTGQPVEPNLQLVEMGRDQPHAEGNIDNLLMMAKTIDFQQTRVDPVSGTVTGSPTVFHRSTSLTTACSRGCYCS